MAVLEQVNEQKIEKLLYTAKTHTTGGRDGGAGRSNDGNLDVKFAVPGTPAKGTNPEQMFAAGWSACFIGAMKYVAGQMKMHLPEQTAVDAEVDLGTNGGGYLFQARLNVSLPGWKIAWRARSWKAHTRTAPIRRRLAATST